MIHHAGVCVSLVFSEAMSCSWKTTSFELASIQSRKESALLVIGYLTKSNSDKTGCPQTVFSSVLQISAPKYHQNVLTLTWIHFNIWHIFLLVSNSALLQQHKVLIQATLSISSMLNLIHFILVNWATYHTAQQRETQRQLPLAKYRTKYLSLM